MTMHHDAGPRAAVAQAAPTLPADPFVPLPRLRTRDRGRLSERPAVFVLATLATLALFGLLKNRPSELR